MHPAATLWSISLSEETISPFPFAKFLSWPNLDALLAFDSVKLFLFIWSLIMVSKGFAAGFAKRKGSLV